MEENIQSSIIRSNLRCERRRVIPTPHPLGCAQCGTGNFRPMAEIMNSSEAQRQPEKYPGKEKHMPKSVVQKSYFMPDFSNLNPFFFSSLVQILVCQYYQSFQRTTLGFVDFLYHFFYSRFIYIEIFVTSFPLYILC